MPKKRKQKLPVFTQWGDPILHKPTKLVSRASINTPAFKKLTARMFRNIEGVGIGLAANQIGLPISLAVIQIKTTKSRKGLKPVPRTVIVNPKITHYSRAKIGGWEGCLSCETPRFWVERSTTIKLRYIDKDDETVARTVNGFEARVFQHEIDHLNGIVCGERVTTKNGVVVSGALISNAWYKSHPNAVPPGLRQSQNNHQK